MIKAVLKLDGEGNISGFSVKGHSGSAPSGKDIICAAVSGIVQTALIGLDEVAGINDTYSFADGNVECELPVNCDEVLYGKAEIIISTMWLGLESIANQYPEFVRIKQN